MDNSNYIGTSKLSLLYFVFHLAIVQIVLLSTAIGVHMLENSGMRYSQSMLPVVSELVAILLADLTYMFNYTIGFLSQNQFYICFYFSRVHNPRIFSYLKLRIGFK